MEGFLCALRYADAAMGIAFGQTLAPDESFTTENLKIISVGTSLNRSEGRR